MSGWATIYIIYGFSDTVPFFLTNKCWKKSEKYVIKKQNYNYIIWQ